MNRVGLLALADPSNGGTFQYTQSMLHAFKRCAAFELTVYTTKTNRNFDGLGRPIRRLPLSRAVDFRLAAMDVIGLAAADPFAQEDLVVAPIYSPILLHTRKPFVFTLHDLQERYLPENFSLAQRAWRRFLQQRLCRRAARIVCESAFVQQDIARFYGIDPRRISVLPSPPALSTDGPLDAAVVAAARARYKLPERFIFYPAQFWRHKNHLRLVEAFARLAARFPDVELLFTGAPRNEFRRVFARVNELGLSTRIRHLGYVDQTDLAVLYRLATGLVMPSLFESVSIPVYEAQQAGTPVCASGILAIADQIGDSGLTFDPLSIDSIASALEQLLRDPQLRARIGAAGRRRFDANGWDRYDLRLRDMVAALLKSREALPAQGGAASGSR